MSSVQPGSDEIIPSAQLVIPFSAPIPEPLFMKPELNYLQGGGTSNIAANRFDGHTRGVACANHTAMMKIKNCDPHV
jgi:hypothetical protein